MPFTDTNNASKQLHESLSPPSCVLLLNGFSGFGKFTIAKALEAKLKLGNTPHHLIANHLLIEPVVAIEPIRNEAHYSLRKSFRKTGFEGLKSLKEERLIIILTAALLTSSSSTPYDDIEQFAEYVDLPRSERLCPPKRNEVDSKTKLVNVDVLESVRRETSISNWEEAMKCGKGGTIFHFELNTSQLGIEKTTQKLWKLLNEAVRRWTGFGQLPAE